VIAKFSRSSLIIQTLKLASSVFPDSTRRPICDNPDASQIGVAESTASEKKALIDSRTDLETLDVQHIGSLLKLLAPGPFEIE
jgi:hypothetical protein